MRRTVWIAVLLSGFYVGCDDGGGAESSTTGGTTTDDEVATTIPVTSVSASMPPITSATTSDTTTTDDDTGNGSDTSTGSSGDPASSTGNDTDTASTGSDDTTAGTAATTTGGETSWEIGWCNLQFPATIEGSTATLTPVFSRVYIAGLTEGSPGNDPDDAVMVDFGYGADGSDPAADAWTWVPGGPNAGWNGPAVGEPNNDEYTVDLQFNAAGTYDYAARVSGDSGASWSYCDLDGLVENGYTPDQAGDATIQ